MNDDLRLDLAIYGIAIWIVGQDGAITRVDPLTYYEDLNMENNELDTLASDGMTQFRIMQDRTTKLWTAKGRSSAEAPWTSARGLHSPTDAIRALRAQVSPVTVTRSPEAGVE
jgi:hypothetical protein